MHCENAFYFLPRHEIARRLQLPWACNAQGRRGHLYKGPWRHVWVELHDYPVADDRAWLPEMHEFVGRMGTRVQMEAEAYVDLLSFKLFLRQRIERKYQVPGENPWL